ncbi:hypothetical protein Dsin_010917 [Dipteronia sinensis]|uniref:AB hydrolase-1 domain-containing protein n=1 Tax=Dipteronia sinensis TaxID=43782 RepID=A0AAE0ATP6_9ROSI|nr:hypothetical protein Dsin_010917 [Dipteronia sinensis]
MVRVSHSLHQHPHQDLRWRHRRFFSSPYLEAIRYMQCEEQEMVGELRSKLELLRFENMILVSSNPKGKVSPVKLPRKWKIDEDIEKQRNDGSLLLLQHRKTALNKLEVWGLGSSSLDALEGLKSANPKKVLSGNYDGYVIGGEEDAGSLPDESDGESSTLISSCFWELKPKFNVHYEKAGCEYVSSPALLFLPGFGVGSFHYEKQLKDLGRDYRVWAIDFLGQGMSLPFENPTPSSKEGCTMERKDHSWGLGDEAEPWANELWDQVCYFIEHVIREPVYVVGNSLGGFVAVYFAAGNPHLVKGDTLLNANLFWGFFPNPIRSPKLVKIFPWSGTFPLPESIAEVLNPTSCRCCIIYLDYVCSSRATILQRGFIQV